MLLGVRPLKRWITMVMHLVKCFAVLLLFPAIENFYCARHSSSPSFPRVSKIESFCEWCQALECSRAWLDQISLKQIVGAANQNSLHWLLQIIFLFNLIMQKILRRSPLVSLTTPSCCPIYKSSTQSAC